MEQNPMELMTREDKECQLALLLLMAYYHYGMYQTITAANLLPGETDQNIDILYNNAFNK